MLGSKIRTARLAALCRRLAQSLAAGLDARKVFEREAQGRSDARYQSRMRLVADSVARGGTISEGLDQTGAYFPSLFRELTLIGEQTGNLAEVYHRLADHYEHQIAVRRTFMYALVLPGAQLAVALAFIGLLIFVMGFLTGADGKPVDILGFGLTGGRGLLIYVSILAAIALGVGLFVRAIVQGALWTRPVQKVLLKLPVWGGFLQLLAMSRLAWTLNLTTNTSLSMDRAIPLCLRATQNARYSDRIDEIVDAACRGRELHDAFGATGVFPTEFLDALEVGERTGQIPETMGRLAEQYREEAQRRSRMLMVTGGFMVGGVMLLLILLLIIRILMNMFLPYVNTINELSNPGGF